ncbi:(+)-neomenthol dehydrogenase [Aspergillus udagawae]|uniref:(+)-neomenthol dehydrogenase n=1 Tax=Aspergillus udagawae TaxID=91492 RepID=A0ABQ1A032_9EURO|nr:(+)-neomenthol dehydrogenase [Aspergillus udagawae]
MATPKIVLVTGANTGLGLEIVRALCGSNDPYEILLASRSLSKGEAAVEALKQEFPASPSSVSAFQLDISDDDSIINAYQAISSKYDRLDVLINNAGIQLPSGDTMGRRKAWNVTYDMNVTGTHIVSETFVPLLLRSASPRLLFITSGTSSLVETTEPNHFFNKSPPAGWPKDQNMSLLAYRASKTALNMVVRDWRRVLNEDGVKVFAVSPGLLATGLAGGAFSKMGAAHPSVGAELVKDVVEGKRDEDEGKIVKRDGVQPW